jgi:hypothetical protein
MEAAAVHPNSIQRFIDGHIERMGVIACAELDVAGNSLPVIKQPRLIAWPVSTKAFPPVGSITITPGRARLRQLR